MNNNETYGGDKVIDFNRAKLERDLAISKANKEFEEVEPRLKKLPQYRGRVPSRTFLGKDPLIKRGQCYWIEADKGLFTVVAKTKKGIQLRPLDLNATVSAGYTIYEMNQAMVAKEPLFDWTDSSKINSVQDELEKFIFTTKNNCYLMYGRETHYFTLFNMVEATGDVKEATGSAILRNIRDCIEPTWDIISIDVDMEDEAFPKVEIWCRDSIKTDGGENPLCNHMLYLFPYDQGVVQVTI